MTLDELNQGKALEADITAITQLLADIEYQFNPQVVFYNEGTGVAQVNPERYAPYIDPEVLDPIRLEAGDSIKNALNNALTAKQAELAAL